MIYYTPVHPSEHSKLLGENFAENLAQEMERYYYPFSKKGRPIQLAKETWEYAVADALPDGEWIGAGKNIVDVKTDDITIDVKGLSCNSVTGMTTEASILQNNKLENDNFASLFESADYSGLMDMFVKPLGNKVLAADNLYIMATIRDKKTGDVYYSLLRVEEHENENFVDEMYMDAKRSVSVPMIDPQFGKTYLYIPKRRLEIRLKLSGMKDYLVWSHKLNQELLV